MTAETPGPAGPDRVSRAGVVIVVVAVIIGLILLGKGYGAHESEVDGAGSSTPKTTVVQTSTTTIVGNPPASVKVKVVNATNTVGLATRTRDMLQVRGYTQVSVGDSPKAQERTTILYTPGAEADAQNVAKALGLDASAVQPMPEPPPVSPGDATVLVMAGLDI